MNIEDEVKILYETFVFCQANAVGDDLERCKKGNEYFFKNQTGLKITCEMILKMQNVMYKILPPSSHPRHEEQLDRMNRLVKECKQYLKEIENGSNIQYHPQKR